MLRLSVLLLALTYLISSANACKCLPLPAHDGFCRTSFLALITVKESSVNEVNHSRVYTFELVKDLTPLRNAQGKTLAGGSRTMSSPLHSANCGVLLEVNETYLVGGNFHHKRHEPFLFSCHSYIEKWPYTGERSQEKLNSYLQQCDIFDKQFKEPK